MKDLFKGCWTIPNLLTFTRILLLPLFVFFFYREKMLLAVAILFISGLTDTLDGKIARKFNQISELGKILDPVADKLTQITIAVMLFLEFRKASNEIIRAFSWIFIFFLVKEAVMVLGGTLMLALGIRPGAAEIYGKISTFFFYGSMLIIISFGPEIGAFVRNNENSSLVLPNWALIGLVSISAFLTLLAFLSYMPETFRQFKERGTGLKEKRK